MNFKKLMLSALLVLSQSLHAQDTIGWGNTRPGAGVGAGRDPWASESQNIRDVELQLNSYYQNQRIDLLRDAYIRSQLQGQQIREVIIVASSQQGNGQARLLANGMSSDASQTIGRQMSQTRFRVDPFANSVGQSLRTLELEMTRGNFYVEKVIFSLLENSGPAWPGPGIPSQPQTEVVRQQVNQSIQTEGGLQLSRLFNLSERQGQSLSRVTVLARAPRGYSQVQLLRNTETSSYSQSLGSSSQRLTFEVNGRIGMEIQSLRLYFRGDVVVEEVALEFDRGSNIPGPGPVLERRIEQVINQRLYETSGVNLISLMRIDSRQHNRIVESVEITMRGADYGTRLSLCQAVMNQPATNCGPMQIMQPGQQRIVLSGLNFARLSELALSVRMGMIDIERIVLNLR